MAALAVGLGRSDLAAGLTAAASALRESAGFPPIPGARIERCLTPARRDLGEATVARLWAAGAELSADEAVALALGAIPAESGNGARPGGRLGANRPGTGLTPREREIATLVSRGMTNRAIAGELVISTATVARHVANILTKLGFQSRAQVAVWMSENDPGR